MLPLYIILGILAFIIVSALIIARVTYKMAFYHKPDGNVDNYQIPDVKQYQDNKEYMISMISELEAIPFEPVTITSHDGLKLYGRYYHVTDGAPVFIEFHGYKSMAIRDFCGGDRIVRAQKYNTLLIDQRAHGKSEGHTVSFGIKERLDCLSWINYVNDRFGKNTEIFLIGVSMGGATVLMASELDLPENVMGIMADCPFSSPWLVISKVARSMGIPAKLAFPFLWLGARLFGGFDLMESDATSAVKNARVPIFLVHGTADHLVPFEMSCEIAKNCASDITFIPFDDAGHGLSYILDSEKYTKEAISFIEGCLKKNSVKASSDRQ